MRNQANAKSVSKSHWMGILIVVLAALYSGCENEDVLKCNGSNSECVFGDEDFVTDGDGAFAANEYSDLDFGPKTIHFDMGHNNHNTLEESYFEFARAFRGRGYNVVPVDRVFTPELLARVDLLVICNPLASEDVGQWILPNPSAYSQSEIDAIVEWVEDGGSLFLIADHMPFPGAAAELAREFGFYFFNGFLTNTNGGGRTVYKKSHGTLLDSPVTSTGYEHTTVEKVVTGTGQAFFAPENSIPILSVPEGFTMRLPVVAWQFDEDTLEVPADGMLQGALLEQGEGRVAVFGEANQFSCKLPETGMCDPNAPDNRQFLLNVISWLEFETKDILFGSNIVPSTIH